MGQHILVDILIILLASLPLVLLVQHFRIPAIAGFLVTGALLGPAGFGVIKDVSEINQLAEVGVALLLFHIGLEFSLSNLRELGRISLGAGILQMLLSILAGFLFGNLLGWEFAKAVFFGCAIALSSTAVVLALLSAQKAIDSPVGRNAAGILILQDLAVIPIIILLKFFSDEQAAFNSANDFMLLLGQVVALFGAFYFFSRYILHHALALIARSRSKELFVVALVGGMLGSAIFTQWLGLSFAIGAFLFGLIIATTRFRFHALSEIGPFRACFSGLFFVSLGMLIDPSFVAENAKLILLLVLFIPLIKGVITTIAVLVVGYPLSVAAVTGLFLGQIGEFSFLVSKTALGFGVIDTELYQLIISAAVITMFLTPFITKLSPCLGSVLGKFSHSFKLLHGRETLALPDQEESLRDHVIISGFGPLGQTIGKMLEKTGIRYIVVELNPLTEQRFNTKDRPVYLGDGASSELLTHCGIEHAKMLAIAVPDHFNAIAIVQQARGMNPKLKIITRSRYRSAVKDFYAAGADIVICEELEAGIEMGHHALKEVGVSTEDVEGFVKEIRKFGSADFF